MIFDHPSFQAQLIRRCPRCGGPQSDRPAVSRTDNVTSICSDCGTEEAVKVWLLVPHPQSDWWINNQS